MQIKGIAPEKSYAQNLEKKRKKPKQVSLLSCAQSGGYNFGEIQGVLQLPLKKRLHILELLFKFDIFTESNHQNE